MDCIAMTQQYQHIEPAGEITPEAVKHLQDRAGEAMKYGKWKVLKTSPRLLELLSKSVVKPAPAKHPLLMPPFVKED